MKDDTVIEAFAGQFLDPRNVPRMVEKLRKDQEDEIRIIWSSAQNKMKELLVDKTAANRVADERRAILAPRGPRSR